MKKEMKKMMHPLKRNYPMFRAYDLHAPLLQFFTTIIYIYMIGVHLILIHVVVITMSYNIQEITKNHLRKVC